MTMNDRPRNCQIAMAATAGSAQVGLCRRGGLGLIPSQGKRPTMGFISVPKIMAPTATDVTTVEEKIIRKIPIPLMVLFAATANARPRRRPRGTTITTKRNVDVSDWRNADDESIEVACERPTYFDGRPG